MNIDKIWIILVSLTSFTFLVGYFKLVSDAIITLLLLGTFIKGLLVIEHFMQLKDVVLSYRIIPILWLGTILLLVGAAYYF
ncbi:hypothetical protein GJV85_11940 [Sulfurimonas aquatica]|uniref:Cytochrome C oxidase subunit IV n=1 Tax=Sulfurimonas aquatica TaxID=2672570 RepID=A0A975B253_9BACT|nr:cytochrome C oxidase subunit IV family protein [Sulfurimonas aquatica]QSZ42794.1 hypothetical protein GJV85_11940 [Sulfurimonas aquatica]